MFYLTLEVSQDGNVITQKTFLSNTVKQMNEPMQPWDSWGPLDNKETKAVNPKGNQPWVLTGRTDAEAEAPILWPPDVKHWLTGKYPDAGKDWRQEEKGMTEDEMVGWHHLINGYEFKQTLWDGEGQGNLMRCSSWGCKELTCLSNWTTTTQGRSFQVRKTINMPNVSEDKLERVHPW